ncbi:MAG: DUF4386 domain-containing protein [Rhodanobacteraceae bacterium]
MATTRTAARTIAVLLLAQMITAPIVNFALLQPVLAAPGFLENAAAHSTRVSIAVVLGLAMVAATVGVAIAALPVFRRYSEAMAFWLLALAIVGLAAAVVENIGVLSMLSLSHAYANAEGANADLLKALSVVVTAPRNWAHYLGLALGGSVACVLYTTLFRFALVPRVLAGFGIVASLLEIVAVAMPIFGQRIVFPMLAPLGLAHLSLIIWLIAKGFADREPTVAGARG